MSGIPAWARVGAKVVCVRRAFNAVTLRHKYPLCGHTYTIRKVTRDSVSNEPIILLEEVVNTTWEIPSSLEPGFPIRYFRPLITRTLEQDAAQFRKLLNTTPVGEDA